MLIDHAPVSVTVAGKRYAINSDFRTSIQFELLATSGSSSAEAITAQALRLYFPVIPADEAAACNALLWFYSCGHPENDAAKQSAAGRQKRTYDYIADENYLYAAFLSEYRIDLEQTRYLHWWKFRALFSALSSGTLMQKIIEYRSADLGKLRGEDRKFYTQMQKVWALPIPADERKKIDMVAEALLHGQSVTDLIKVK